MHREVEWFAAFPKNYVPGFEDSAISAVAGSAFAVIVNEEGQSRTL